MKKILKHFFLETKIGKWIVASMALLNSIEGIVHLVVAGVGITGVFKMWGLATFSKMLFLEGFDTAVTSWAVMLPNIENIAFGVFSLICGYVLGIVHHHH